MDTLTELKKLAPWHFDIEVAPGVRTTSGNLKSYENPDHRDVATIDPEEMRPLFQRIGIAGKSFLDVACNAGGYSFLACRMGASRVFGFDVREHWIRQAEFLSRQLGVRGVTFKTMPLDKLDSSERFDITLFKGIFYHLPDPIHDLRRVCSMTMETIIIDTATSTNVPEHCLEPMQESTTQVMSGVDGLAWRPGGPEAIKYIVSSLGFPHTHVAYWIKETWPGWGRTRVVASRKPI